MICSFCGVKDSHHANCGHGTGMDVDKYQDRLKKQLVKDKEVLAKSKLLVDKAGKVYNE